MSMRGWGRGLRRAVGNWYQELPIEKLAYQVVKYQARDGWSNRDLLRLAHPKTEDAYRNFVYSWIVDGIETTPEADEKPEGLLAPVRLLWAFERAKVAQDAKEVIKLVQDYRLPREAIPTQFLKEAGVWEALLEDMPMTALIRNLGTMTKVGLVAPMSDASRKVVAQLSDIERLRKARVHPFQVLVAMNTYAQGHGEKGHSTWEPVQPVVNALDAAFYASFGNVTPSGQRFYLGVDVSGSMCSPDLAGLAGITPRVGAAAMALITAATEQDYVIKGFCHKMVDLGIDPRQRLDDVIGRVRRSDFGGTDCALPMVDALDKGLKVDCFVVLTDNQTWAGKIHPVQALRQYREKTGIPARLVVVGMDANEFSIADARDAGMLDVVGLDTATPQLISDFAAGKI